MMQPTEPTFDLAPEIYDQLVNWPRRLEREGAFFRRVFDGREIHRVLDVACGTGQHAKMFESWGHVVHGIDGSPAMIDHCRRVHGESGRLRWTHARMQSLPAFDQPFDAIVCLGNSLAILPDNDAVATTIAHMAERLGDAGVMVVHVLNVGRLPDGPIVWQKARPASVDGEMRAIVKGVHRCGERAFVDVAEVVMESERGVGRTGDDLGLCHSTPILWIRPDILQNAFTSAGLSDVRLFGDHAMSPFDPNDSPDLIAVASRE